MSKWGKVFEKNLTPFLFGEASPNPIGYWQKGFRMNRIYAGCKFNFTPFLSFSPQYVFETNYDYDGYLSAVNHYAHVTLSYTVKLFK